MSGRSEECGVSAPGHKPPATARDSEETMSDRFENIDALVDGEPVDRTAIEEALSDRAGRDYLVDAWVLRGLRSEEHTSELQSLRHLVCRLLLEKKKPT